MRLLRLLPLLLLLAGAVALVVFGGLEQLAPDNLLRRANSWLDFAGQNPWTSLTALTGVIIASTALGLPGAAALFGVAGFLLGVPMALIAAGLGNMLGTAILYLAIRAAFPRDGDGVRSDAATVDAPVATGPAASAPLDAGMLARARAQFRRNPLAFALFLRAVPVAPNGVNTALLAALRCPWPIFLTSSALGPLPNAALLAWLGTQLADEARAGRIPDASVLADPRWWLPLALIALLALAPLLLRRRRRVIATCSDS